MVHRLRRLGALLPALFLGGCCGGYSVVQTTVVDRADLRAETPTVIREGDGHVLQWSRLGEPPNDCGSTAQFIEELRVRVPSLRDGDVHALGSPGVVATYERRIGDTRIKPQAISGSVTIGRRVGSDVEALLRVHVALEDGEVLDLDDTYSFHPRGPGQQGGIERERPALRAGRPSCRL